MGRTAAPSSALSLSRLLMSYGMTLEVGERICVFCRFTITFMLLVMPKGFSSGSF